MENNLIDGVAVEVYNYTELLDANLPDEIRHELIKAPKEITWNGNNWGGFYNRWRNNVTGTSRNIVIINDSNDIKTQEHSKRHEETHAYFRAKTKTILSSDNYDYINESIAKARADILCNNEKQSVESILLDAVLYTPNFTEQEEMSDAYSLYFDAAKDIGDEVALALARDTYKEEGWGSLFFAYRFDEKVSDYKLNLQRIFW